MEMKTNDPTENDAKAQQLDGKTEPVEKPAMESPATDAVKKPEHELPWYKRGATEEERAANHDLYMRQCMRHF